MNYRQSAKRNREAGQTLAIVGLALVVLLIAAGFAIDMGYLRYERRLAQMAADSAAIAGAAACVADSGCANLNSEGQTNASYNGFTNGQQQTTVEVNTPPWTSGDPYNGSPNYVEAVVTRNVPTFFARILGTSFSSIPISARAVATLGPGKSCVYTTAPTGGIGSFNLNGGFTSDCVVDVGGDLNIPDDDSYYFDTYGATYAGNYNNAVNVATPVPVPGGAVADPLPNLTNGAGPPEVLPPASCGATYTRCAGYYQGGLTISGSNENFQPGTYVFGGPLVITGNGNVVTGTGVTFYMANGSAVAINYGPTIQYPYSNNFLYNSYNCPGTLNVQSTAVVQFSAPTDPSNPYAGVLLIQPTSNYTPANIMLNNGDTCQGSENPYQDSNPFTQQSPPTQTSYMWGVMDMPSASVTLFGQGLESDNFCSSVPMFTTVIASTLNIDGHVSFGVTDCAPPDLPGSAVIYPYPLAIPNPLKDAVLVE
jgi:hypothetical protein